MFRPVPRAAKTKPGSAPEVVVVVVPVAVPMVVIVAGAILAGTPVIARELSDSSRRDRRRCTPVKTSSAVMMNVVAAQHANVFTR
jgi:hypothetical protein